MHSSTPFHIPPPVAADDLQNYNETSPTGKLT